MSTMQDINSQLFRPIKSGVEYDRLFPNSKCVDTKLATGNTSIAIKKMKEWAKKYKGHTDLLAPVLEGSNLKETVDNIQDFLYWHIQYAIDGEKQNLKSPACAWATRKEGTDCKSYSIFASTILLNLGIKHYFRRIVQAQVPEAYTHVYVVVPLNQDTGKLGEYYVIDGTIQLNNEIPFIKHDDLYMEPNLSIHGLASPVASLGCAGECNCSQQGQLAGWVSDIGGVFSDSSWSFSCIGGTYDIKDAQRFRQLCIQGFDNLFAQFNNQLNGLVISPENVGSVMETANTILRTAAALKDKATRAANKSWSSSCSKSATRSFRDDATYFYNLVNNTFLPYLNQFFVTQSTTVTITNTDIAFAYSDGQGGMKNEFTADTTAKQYTSLTLKENLNLPYFIVEPELAEIAGEGAINLNDLLSSLTEIAVQQTFPNSGTQTGNGTTTGGNGNVGQLPTGNDEPQQAGFGLMAGIGLLAIAAGTYFYAKKKKQ